MSQLIAADDRGLLQRHGLEGFEPLWQLPLDAVDEPNTGRGGWSSVFRLELEGKGFYLKRQSDYLTRTLRHPFGEPTFACEFRNIRRYQQLGIPALEAVYYAESRVNGTVRAILMTRALDGWDELHSLLEHWSAMPAVQRQAILLACGQLARTLHGAGQVHGCFYPKHIFLRARAGGYQAKLIDLEKNRPLLFGRRDRSKDLEPLLRRAQVWSEADIRLFLGAYVDRPADSGMVDHWMTRLLHRRRYKEAH